MIYKDILKWVAEKLKSKVLELLYIIGQSFIKCGKNKYIQSF